MSSKRILILRLSSFGDIVQILPSVDVLAGQNVIVDFYTKPEFKYIVEPHPEIQKTYYFDKKQSFLSQVCQFKNILNQNQYDYIYDAHSNNRTYLIRLLTLPFRFRHRFFSKSSTQKKLLWIRRPKHRLRRLIYFKLKFRDIFPNPMIAAQSFLTPLLKSNVIKNKSTLPNKINEKYNNNILKPDDKITQSNYIILAPSAAWPLKRWPTDYFLELISLRPKYDFVVLGGPDDEFAKDIIGPNVLNLVGKLSWGDTGKWILKSKALIAADTGVLHWADYMGIKSIGILGPTAFGKPFRSSTLVLNKNLACSPCTKDGRGQCKIKETQKCLKDIKPIDVSIEVDRLMLTSKNKNESNT
jgi:ADP-heptose:LPS heptosyltransferase